jgi:succinate-acetate transporter protein
VGDRARPVGRPFGVWLFLAYAGLILVGIGLSLRTIVDQATLAPVSLIGVVVMILLAYTIFTMTLVIQRKQAAFGLAVGLASLTIPGVLLLAISPVHPAVPVFAAAFSLLLFRGLLRPEVRTYLSEP